MRGEEEMAIPNELRALAAELDELGGASRGRLVEDAPDFEGTDFRPLDLLGRGGMGAVYAARQLSLDREVAVKVLAPSLSHDADFRGRFLGEARTIAGLHHPNIVQTISAGDANGRLFFAMERVAGKTAAEHAFRRDGDVVELGMRVADALAYAHSRGVVHRDVKPSNVFVGGAGTVKLGDFGLACLEDAEIRDFSGTRKYMAPEQVAHGAASALSDQYSFGVMMLELSEPFESLRRDRDFAAIVAKATAERPSDRYPGMAQVADELERFLHFEPVCARPAGFAHRLGLWGRRNPQAAVAAGTALLCLAGFVVALLIGHARASNASAATEQEAANAARALVASVISQDGRASADRRAAELKRALEAAESLAERYPGNPEIQSAVDDLKEAVEQHARRPRNPARRPEERRRRISPRERNARQSTP